MTKRILVIEDQEDNRRILRDPDVVAAAVAFVAARSAERGIAATVEGDPQARPLEILMAG